MFGVESYRWLRQTRARWIEDYNASTIYHCKMLDLKQLETMSLTSLLVRIQYYQPLEIISIPFANISISNRDLEKIQENHMYKASHEYERLFGGYIQRILDCIPLAIKSWNYAKIFTLNKDQNSIDELLRFCILACPLWQYMEWRQENPFGLIGILSHIETGTHQNTEIT